MMEYWRQCALWLINCKVLPANHRVTWESAQVFDLAQTLRDGVLLCHLLNNLRPQSINLKEINLRPQMSQVGHDCRQPWLSVARSVGRRQLGPRPPKSYASLEFPRFSAKITYLVVHR